MLIPEKAYYFYHKINKNLDFIEVFRYDECVKKLLLGRQKI
jgi:hypothetical protein